MDDIFSRHGFIKDKDDKLAINVTIGDKNYVFVYETNYIFDIPDTDIRFAITFEKGGKRSFFINQECNPSADSTITPPYRTYYEGLMKEPFKLIYPLDKPLKIETDKHVIIEVKIEEKEEEKKEINPEEIKELFRFTSRAQFGSVSLFPPKFDFIFYNNHLEVYRKGKLIRNVDYGIIRDVFIFKKFHTNVTINYDPVGFNICNVPDEISTKIKQIIGK